MSIPPREKVMLDIVAMFHQYSGDDGTIDVPGLVNLMKENFTNFLRGCEKSDTDYLSTAFEKKDENKDKKINYSEFLSLLGDVAIDYHKIMHGAVPCFGGSQSSRPTQGPLETPMNNKASTPTRYFLLFLGCVYLRQNRKLFVNCFVDAPLDAEVLPSRCLLPECSPQCPES
uniref:EF-hand domain-containing protein n=1 Tax=Macaca fascicularis TaxID=9541 RepID=A0A2K5W313_MACFA